MVPYHKLNIPIYNNFYNLSNWVLAHYFTPNSYRAIYTFFISQTQNAKFISFQFQYTTMAKIIALFSLLFALSMKLNFSCAGTVLDSDGSPLQNGGNYYILPGFESKGGGVTFASFAATQPSAVIQSSLENFLGDQVTVSDGTMVIQTDNMVTLKFTNIPNHDDSSSTWMVLMDELAKVWYVGIGRAEDYSNDQIKRGFFQIKNYNLGYKFVFCSATNASDCEDVGTYTDGYGNNRLALRNGGVTFKFKNANKT